MNKGDEPYKGTWDECPTCGKQMQRVALPCPEKRPGCAVFHFRLVCYYCEGARKR